MTFSFASISKEEFLKRVFKSGYDSNCYQTLSNEYFPSEEAKLRIRKHQNLGKQSRQGELEILAEKCSELPKYRNYSPAEVIFETISKIQMASKWYNNIFGHVEDERDVYPSLKKSLRHEYGGDSVYDTSQVRSKLVRFADFTVVKRPFFGGPTIYSFDVKTQASSFERFLSQTRDSRDFQVM